MKALCIIILIVLAIDIVLPFLVAIPYKGYSHKTTVMSVLGAKESPLRFLYNVWTIISGCAFVLLGYVIYKYYGYEHKGLCIAIWVLLALYGLGCEIISGFFPVNENANEKTPSSVIHGIGSVVGFTALLAVPLLLGIIHLKSNENTVGIIGIVGFALSFIFFAVFVMSDKPTFKNTVLSLTGVWQRASMYAMYLPTIVFIINLFIAHSL